jgi:hypothetical protein
MADEFIFDHFPAAGAGLSPRHFSAMGTNRDRYQEASEVQRYSGIAPVRESSGSQSWA